MRFDALEDYAVSFITNMFKGQGSGYAQTQNQNQANVAGDAGSILSSLMPAISGAYNTAASYEPQRQAQISQLMALNSPGNTKALQSAYANKAYGNAARAGQQASQMTQAMGGSPALDAGNQTAIANNAANAANAYDAQTDSPEYQMMLGNNELQLMNQAQNSPLFNDFGQMAQTIYGQPKVTVQPGLGSFLGQLAGTFGGPLGNKIFGGGNNNGDGSGDGSEGD